ncbi:MAG: molybdopterin-binding protein [Synergistaceae bacterium]|jgi:hypothetical protein|nr:molybdopterin-binding protein [Synergistaceae bacterium]
MRLTEIKLEDALGRPLAHDLTRIDAVNGTKGARFKKGQIITDADIPILRAMGREHLSILELEPDELHEDDAARALCEALLGENCSCSSPDEGRITIRADCGGFLFYDSAMVNAVNADTDWTLATLAPNRQVTAGQPIAGFRIIPLAMKKDRVGAAIKAAGKIDVRPFAPLKAGLVVTGREIVEGLVEDAFTGKFRKKISALGGTLLGRRFCSDDSIKIAEAIKSLMAEGAELIVCTGGMSVDSDDRTPGGIGIAADRISFRGVPVLPGAMLMLGWADVTPGGHIAIIGAPACVVHDERTALDKILPFIFAGADPSPYVRQWGVGGLCEHCVPCHWPACSFSTG